MQEKGCYFTQAVSTQEARAMIEHEDAEYNAQQACLKAVANAAQAVQDGAVARLEHEGLGKIIVHMQDWRTLAAALGAYDALAEANGKKRVEEVDWPDPPEWVRDVGCRA